MLFKMRSLFYSKAGNAEHLSQQIARVNKTTSDQIPPAYPSDGEKLLFIGIEANGSSPEKNVMDFCTNLTPQRARNVAFYVITKGSGADAAQKLKEAVLKNGVNVAGDIHVIKVSGLFKQNKVKQSDADELLKWADAVVQSLAEN